MQTMEIINNFDVSHGLTMWPSMPQKVTIAGIASENYLVNTMNLYLM